MNSDQTKINLLRSLLDDGVYTIGPIYDVESPFAYAYPALAKYVELPPDKAVDLLDDLASRAVSSGNSMTKFTSAPPA